MLAPGQVRIVLVLGAWFAAVVAGFASIERYASRGSPPGKVVETWPRNSILHMDDRAGWTLMVFMHPRCPCSRATVGELARLAARTGDRCGIVAVFYAPDGAEHDPAWCDSDLVRAARALPGARVGMDPGGRESARFGATTSGAAMLFDRSGRLVFSGGLTASRGHEGDNAGCEAIGAIVLGLTPAATTTPVYGCPISEAACAGGEDTCPK
jgi:hypothetical protein